MCFGQVVHGDFHQLFFALKFAAEDLLELLRAFFMTVEAGTNHLIEGTLDLVISDGFSLNLDEGHMAVGAGHAILRVNAGFEDCFVLNQLLDKYEDEWEKVLPAYQDLRKPDNDAIAQLALDNFIEMRDLVGDEDFLLRKKIEAQLHDIHSERWIPLYSMVTFREDIRYSEAQSDGKLQKQVMDEVMSRPDIKSNWERLNFEEIVSNFEKLKAS